MNSFIILKHFIGQIGIMYDDTIGFPDEQAISKELVEGMDFEEDWAWSAAGLILHYRKMDSKDMLMRMLERGVEIKLSEDLKDVVKDHIEKYPVVGVNDERAVMLKDMTTNDMFLK